MCEINSAEKIFLSKLEILLSKFDEIDAINEEIQQIIDDEPEKQRQLDLLLSDYYHLLESDDLSDIEILNVGKKIHDTRTLRRDENRVSTLIACYEQHKNKLQYSVKPNRDMFRQAMRLKTKNLHEDYKYRILTDNDFESFKANGDVCFNAHKKKKKFITKEQIEDCIRDGVRTNDMAKKFDVTASYISRLKKKYGLDKESLREARISN